MLRKRKTFNRIVKTNLKYQAKEFFENSTLHGIRYIAEKGLSFSEKFMWFCFVAISAVSAFVIIGSLWEKFQTNPTITGVDTDFSYPQIEFPTITVCPEKPYNVDLVNQTVNDILSESEDVAGLLEIITQLSYDNLEEAAAIASKISSAGIDFEKAKTIREWAFKVAKEKDEIFNSCSFADKGVNCANIFKPIYSERGFCYSFNAYYYSTDKEEIKNQDINSISRTDRKHSFEFSLNERVSIFMNDIEETLTHEYRPKMMLNPNAKYTFFIVRRETDTTADTRQLTTQQRKCIFHDEMNKKRLYMVDGKYSRSACMKQCRIDKAIKYCKCIPPFYLLPEQAEWNACGVQHFNCLEKNMTSALFSSRMCSYCELNCHNTVYEIEKFIINQETTSRVIIEFLQWPTIRYKREILFGVIDLLVSFGGIAGLFLGFSLLSGVEILYYFSMRAVFMMHKNREKLYEMQKEEDNRYIPIYNLSLKFKVKRSTVTVDDIQMVKPVEFNTFDASRTSDVENARPLAIPPMRVKNRQDIFLPTNGKIDALDASMNTSIVANYIGVGVSIRSVQLNGSDKQASTQSYRNNIFRSFSISPYNRNIVPLDKNFRHSPSREKNLLYHGYLP